jgi:hypothetical protein
MVAAVLDRGTLIERPSGALRELNFIKEHIETKDTAIDVRDINSAEVIEGRDKNLVRLLNGKEHIGLLLLKGPKDTLYVFAIKDEEEMAEARKISDKINDLIIQLIPSRAMVREDLDQTEHRVAGDATVPINLCFMTTNNSVLYGTLYHMVRLGYPKIMPQGWDSDPNSD